MKFQYSMTTHNHITSILNIFKGRTGKRLMLFLFFNSCIGNRSRNKKDNHTANQ